MGSKYTTLATSGYNSSPPADDGSQTASNLITWAGIKSKLADPVKTLADSENTALVTAFDYSVRQITSSDNSVAGDHMKCVEIAPTVTTAVTISLGDAVTMTNNYRVFVKNSSARNQTVSRVTGGDTIDGVAGSITLPPGAGAIFQTNATPNGYLTVAWFGPISDGTAVVAGGTDGTKKIRFEVDGLTTATTRVLTPPDRDLTLRDAPALLGELASTSGTNVDFSGIPSWVTKVILQFVGVSTNGTDFYHVQIGPSGGVATSGYLGASSTLGAGTATTNFTAAFGIRFSDATNPIHGSITLTLENASTNTWVASGVLGQSGSAQTVTTAGSVALSGVLNKLRVTTSGGVNTFDAGAINILYE